MRRTRDSPPYHRGIALSVSRGRGGIADGQVYTSKKDVTVIAGDTDGQPKTVEIPSGAIASWPDGEIRVEGEGWEPISAQLDLANPIRIVAACGTSESNALEATVYA